MGPHRPQVPREEWADDEHDRRGCRQVLGVEFLPHKAPRAIAPTCTSVCLLPSAPPHMHCIAGDQMLCLRSSLVQHDLASGKND